MYEVHNEFNPLLDTLAGRPNPVVDSRRLLRQVVRMKHQMSPKSFRPPGGWIAASRGLGVS